MIALLALALALLMGYPPEPVTTDTHAEPPGAGSEVVTRPAPASDAVLAPASIPIPPTVEDQTLDRGLVVEPPPAAAPPETDALVHTDAPSPVDARLCRSEHGLVRAEWCDPAFGWTDAGPAPAPPPGYLEVTP